MSEQSLAIAYASWQEWRPQDYLAEYYTELMPDEQYAMEFLVESLRSVTRVPYALDFGCGPTVHHAFPMAAVADEIHAAEYLPANRAAVQAWLNREPQAHNWLAFAEETLRLETRDAPTPEQIEAREAETRRRLIRLLPGDAGEKDPLGADMRGFYPLVTSHYCAEGATNDKATWRRFMTNILSLVSPGGTVIFSACGGAEYYMVGDHRFPCAGVTGSDLLECLQANGFGHIDLRVREVPDHSEQGYGSVLFARAVRR